MLIFKKKFFISFLLIFSFGIAFAQTPDFSSNFSIDIVATPANPRPFNDVKLTLSSLSSALGSAKITWYVNGESKSAGIGQTSFSIKAGDLGTVEAIKAVAVTNDGNSAEATFEIIPENIDFIVEPDTYVPPFYQGKPIYSPQSRLRIIAITNVVENGQKISKNNLIFKWKENDTSLVANSGTGMNTLALDSKITDKQISIGLSVYDGDKLIGQTSKILKTQSPEIIFYENSPLYGILYNKALADTFDLGSREELHVIAKPYFFSTISGANLTYNWKVNGDSVSPSGTKDQVILRQANSGAGSASVSLDIKNPNQFLQYTSALFNINFGQ